MYFLFKIENTWFGTESPTSSMSCCEELPDAHEIVRRTVVLPLSI